MKILITLLISLFLLSGCGNDGYSFSGGGQAEPDTKCTLTAAENSSITVTGDLNCDENTAIASDQGNANLDQSETELANPSVPISGSLGIGGLTTTQSCPAGTTFVNDSRGPGCSDGAGGFTPFSASDSDS